MNAHERINAFQAWLDEGAVGETIGTPAGRFFSTPDHPAIWDLNYLRAEIDAVDPRLVLETVDEHSERLGLKHRKVIAHSSEISESLTPFFADNEGWRTISIVEMVLVREPDRVPPVAEEVGWDELASFRREVAERGPYADSEDMVRMLVEKNVPWNQAGNARHFVMRDGGRIVSGCDLFTDGATAQVEEVDTLEEARGRGYARAIVTTASRAATRAGCDLIFLLADENDWPKDLYKKLGFEVAGTHREFLKEPPG